MTAQIIRGNALNLPLADDSVDLVVTSPPYFGLRSYQDGGEHYDGQIGSEPTPAEFVDALIAATREMVRVTKPSGSIWVNLGDKYASGGRTSYDVTDLNGARGGVRAADGFRPKTLLGIPWRYALRCIDDLGLILRAEVIWSKPNGLPESVTDRVRRSHEQWFHFTLNPRYYSAVDEIREAAIYPNDQRHLRGGRRSINPDGSDAGGNTSTVNPLGKLPGSVWTVPRVSEGSDLIRNILGAVAAGALTVDEGERLWTGSSTSWGTSTSPASAGTGRGIESRPGTGRSRSSAPVDARSSRTDAPTSCSSDPSPTGSPSTTSAATPAASGPTTSSLSRSARTSAEPTPSAPPVGTGTPSPTPTPTSPQQASPTRSAGPAPSPESDAGESVWLVPTQPLKVPAELGIDHFAAYPMELVRRIVQGWSPRGVCVACGEGRRPVVGYDGPHDMAPVRVIRDWDREEWAHLFSAWREESGLTRADMVAHFPHYKNAESVKAQFSNWERAKNIPQAQDWDILCGVLGTPPQRLDDLAHQAEMRPVRGGNFQASEGARKSGGAGAKQFHHKEPPTRAVTGHACACPDTTADTRPGTVLDPFSGTGTTALVASALGRHGIGVDMSSDYCRLAEWRTTDPKQIAAAMQVKRAPEPQIDGQGELWSA